MPAPQLARADELVDVDCCVHESAAIGPKRTFLVAPHMSAFGCKADMTICGVSAFAVAIGGKADMD